MTHHNGYEYASRCGTGTTFVAAGTLNPDLKDGNDSNQIMNALIALTDNGYPMRGT